MELERQVCSLELAKRLEELGVEQESLFYWLRNNPIVVHESDPEWVHTMDGYSAFTVAELGEMLPKNENIVTMYFSNGHAQIAIQGDIELEEGLGTRWGAASKCIEATTEADARAKMLIYLLENDLLSNTRGV